MKTFKSPLYKMTQTTPTAFWNDSCSVEELTYAIDNGAVGATANPVIVGNVLKKEMHLWEDRIYEIIEENTEFSEDEIAWQLIDEMSVKGAELLLPAFYEHNGRNGRLSVQTNPKYYRNPRAITEQAVHFDTLAPNIIVKIPATRAGIAAIEESTYRGVSINATVCFTVPQAVAVAEAVERGFSRREKEGKDISQMGPVCTIMVGRLDDWLKVVANREGIITNPGYLEWAGVAAMKKAYQIYRQRGYRLRLLAAAYRNHFQWSEFIGGDVVVTIPYKWQLRFNNSDVAVLPRIENPVDPAIIKELEKKFPDFVRAYDEKGMKPEEFEYFGASARTLRQFLAGYAEFLETVREFMIPNPDIKL